MDFNCQSREKENYLKDISFKLEQATLEVNQIKIAAKDMKDIVETLKSRYKDEGLKNRLMMIKNQHSRFNVLLSDLKEQIIYYSKEKKSVSKNINGVKEKYKDILQKEEEILNTISKNLSMMKIKI